MLLKFRRGCGGLCRHFDTDRFTVFARSHPRLPGQRVEHHNTPGVRENPAGPGVFPRHTGGVVKNTRVLPEITCVLRLPEITS